MHRVSRPLCELNLATGGGNETATRTVDNCPKPLIPPVTE
jgi:hypothetical protein